jgi:hypothetical protein
MGLIDDALREVEKEIRKREEREAQRLPMRRARFCDLLWDALAIRMDSKQLPEGEPSLIIDGLTFVLMLPPMANGSVSQAYLGLEVQCSSCEKTMRFSVTNLLGLGLLLSGPSPLCSVCAPIPEEALEVAEEVAREPTPEEALVVALRTFIHSSS